MSCPLKLQTYLRWFVTGASASPALKMRTSADNWQPERASLESCCSASSAHGTARTEAQRLVLLACFAPSNRKRIFGCPCGGLRSPALKMRTFADCSQPERASLQSCCSASSAHGTARTEAQRLGLLACLATSNFKRSLGMGGVPARLLSQPCSENANVCRQLAARRSYPGKLLLSLICPWQRSHRGTENGAPCLSCHLKLQT